MIFKEEVVAHVKFIFQIKDRSFNFTKNKNKKKLNYTIISSTV